jgi:hypothetical protein
MRGTHCPDCYVNNPVCPCLSCANDNYPADEPRTECCIERHRFRCLHDKNQCSGYTPETETETSTETE